MLNSKWKFPWEDLTKASEKGYGWKERTQHEMAETREMAAKTTKFKSDGFAKLNCSLEKLGVVGGLGWSVSEVVRTTRE